MILPKFTTHNQPPDFTPGLRVEPVGHPAIQTLPYDQKVLRRQLIQCGLYLFQCVHDPLFQQPPVRDALHAVLGFRVPLQVTQDVIRD